MEAVLQAYGCDSGGTGEAGERFEWFAEFVGTLLGR